MSAVAASLSKETISRTIACTNFVSYTDYGKRQLILYAFLPVRPRNPGLRIFFFSSRRRHTRCGRDWSSDVCSSDLVEVAERGDDRVGVRTVARPDGRQRRAAA